MVNVRRHAVGTRFSGAVKGLRELLEKTRLFNRVTDISVAMRKARQMTPTASKVIIEAVRLYKRRL